MCNACLQRTKTERRLLSKQEFTAEERQAFEQLLGNYRDELQPIEDAIEAWVNGADAEDLASLEDIREQISLLVDGRQASFEAVFREGGERGAEAGRAVAGRRFDLDVAFDVVPDRTLEVIDDWVETAAGSTLETITEDSARWLRGAHEEGLSIDDIASQLNDELFEGRLEEHVAERAARTGTVSTSNAGSHSAFEDADSVVGEEWLTEIDGRERDSHASADGQIVPVGTTFDVDGVYMDHPGDPTAPVGEIVNCRCTIVPVFADDLDEGELDALEAGERLKAVDGELQKLGPDGPQPIAA